MSRFFSSRFDTLEAYTPGEQPNNTDYVKLNTNESPFPPLQAVADAVAACRPLNLYSDPTCSALISKLSEVYGVSKDRIIPANGSDETLYFSFLAFCGPDSPAVFPDITYGFYPVFANVTGTPHEEIPLKADMTIDINDYVGIGRNIFIANPNAPTGICLPVRDIEKIVKSNPSNVVVIDEAYIDFGGESALPLIDKYDNLLVVRTYSKSRSLAGARLGFAFGNPGLIKDLNTIRYSTNPYNINSMTMAAGIAALENEEYTAKNCRTVMQTRERVSDTLKDLGFEVLPSCANFIFAKHPAIDGGYLYEELKRRSILIRHFTLERICQYNRITIGTADQMDILINEIKNILKEEA